MNEDERQQREYYAATAMCYDSEHRAEDAEHARALEFIVSFAAQLGLHTGLDVGAGTGRAIRYMESRGHGIDVKGIEPVQALIDVAVDRHGIEPGRIVRGSGAQLPFDSDSFDFVMAQAVMHHVPAPTTVVSEMLRVARRAVFIVDTNRFANGRPAARVIKLAMAKAGLWGALYRIRTRGHGYRVSERDGLAYSYSVYDSLPLLESWGDEVQLLSVTPLERQFRRLRHFQPLFTSQTIFMCAFKNELELA